MTFVGRDDPARRLKGRNPSVDRRNSETGGRGKPLPYGMNGETSHNEGRASLGLAPTANHRGRASLGLAPTANHGYFRDTAGAPLPYGMAEKRPATGDGRPQRAAPTASQANHSKIGQREGQTPVKNHSNRDREITNREERSPCRSRARNCLYWRGRSPL